MKVPPSSPAGKVPAADRLLIDENYAARMCGVSRMTFRSWVAAHVILPVQLPVPIKRNLYRRSDVERLVASLPTNAGACVASGGRGA
jgi:hypothetical protein